jgi:hypothetical protein
LYNFVDSSVGEAQSFSDAIINTSINHELASRDRGKGIGCWVTSTIVRSLDFEQHGVTAEDTFVKKRGIRHPSSSGNRRHEGYPLEARCLLFFSA